MSILRTILQVQRLKLGGIKRYSKFLTAPNILDQVSSWECAMTFILQGLCYDLKKDIMLELQSAHPDGGSS